MTPSEFKAWFDGFTEALDGVPTEDQWKRIKARVGEIDGRAVTEHVYINRYLPYYQNYPTYWGPLYTYCGVSGVSGMTMGMGGNLNSGASAVNYTGNGSGHFDSHGAMLSLGRAEAASMNS